MQHAVPRLRNTDLVIDTNKNEYENLTDEELTKKIKELAKKNRLKQQ